MKIHCSVLAEDAIKAAIADYRQKRNNQNKKHNMFSHQTKIYTPDGFAKIRNLKIGHEIISMNDSGKMIASQISEIQKVYVAKEGLLCLRFDHMKKPVYCSVDQEFFYINGSESLCRKIGNW